jgi:hypothetical protein
MLHQRASIRGNQKYNNMGMSRKELLFHGSRETFSTCVSAHQKPMKKSRKEIRNSFSLKAVKFIILTPRSPPNLLRRGDTETARINI